MLYKLSPVDKWELARRICRRKEFQTAFEKRLLKSPGGQRKLGRFRELQAVYAAGMMRRQGWAREMTDGLETFAEATSQRVLGQAKEHRLSPEPSENQLKERCDMVRVAF